MKYIVINFVYNLLYRNLIVVPQCMSSRILSWRFWLLLKILISRQVHSELLIYIYEREGEFLGYLKNAMDKIKNAYKFFPLFKYWYKIFYMRVIKQPIDTEIKYWKACSYLCFLKNYEHVICCSLKKNQYCHMLSSL